jgi:hypothetical protein
VEPLIARRSRRLARHNCSAAAEVQVGSGVCRECIVAAERLLTPQEAALLRKIVVVLSEEVAPALEAQIASALVVGGPPTMLAIEVGDDVQRVGLDNGPIPVTAISADGEVLVWLTEGRLSALEYAWTSDAVPSGMPSADMVTVTP